MSFVFDIWFYGFNEFRVFTKDIYSFIGYSWYKWKPRKAIEVIHFQFLALF